MIPQRENTTLHKYKKKNQQVSHPKYQTLSLMDPRKTKIVYICLSEQVQFLKTPSTWPLVWLCILCGCMLCVVVCCGGCILCVVVYCVWLFTVCSCVLCVIMYCVWLCTVCGYLVCLVVYCVWLCTVCVYLVCLVVYCVWLCTVYNCVLCIIVCCVWLCTVCGSVRCVTESNTLLVYKHYVSQCAISALQFQQSGSC